MKKLLMTALCISFSLVLLGPTVHAEMAKEGSGAYRGAKSGTVTIIKMGDHMQINWDEAGVMVEVPEDSPFLNASFRTMGSYHAVKGQMEGQGCIVITRPNGDQIFGTLTMGGKAKAGPSYGKIEFTGGTGECEGITGGMDLRSRPKVMPSKEGTYQQLAIGEFNWKLP
jgi:hypothetical protein